MYDRSGVGVPMRSWLCVTLGVWHPYKQANSVLWNHFGPRFLAPYFNHMVPAANFSNKAKLVTIVTYFTYMRLAYVDLKQDLCDAIERSKETKRTNPKILDTLLDLQSIFEYFLPVLSFSCLSNINEACCTGGGLWLSFENGRW